jgi:hypothetical protein
MEEMLVFYCTEIVNVFFPNFVFYISTIYIFMIYRLAIGYVSSDLLQNLDMLGVVRRTIVLGE